jgi:hypothetical protein
VLTDRPREIKSHYYLEMEHPYKEYEKTELWRSIEEALENLIENEDICLQTRPELVIGYLCNKIDRHKILSHEK